MAQSGVGPEGEQRGCDPPLSGCLEYRATVVLPPAKPEEEPQGPDPVFLTLSHQSHRFPRAARLLLSRELARHNNGNQTLNQTCPPRAPLPPPPLPPSGSREPNGACRGQAGKLRPEPAAPSSPGPAPCVLPWPRAPLVSALRSRAPRCFSRLEGRPELRCRPRSRSSRACSPSPPTHPDPAD